MIVDSLIYKTGADLSGLGRDLKKMGAMVGATFGSDLKSIKAPKIDAPKMDKAGSMFSMFDPSVIAGQLRGSFASLGGQIKGAVRQAVQPITDMGTDFKNKFDTIGPTFLKLSQRIDSSLRFPKFVKEVQDFQTFFLKRMGVIGKQASDQLNSSFASVGLGDITKAIRDGLNPVAIADPITKAEPAVRSAFMAALYRPFDAVRAKLDAGYASLAQKVKIGAGYGTGAATHVAPNMATAFIGARARNSRGQITGMQTAPKRAASTTIAASDAPKTTGWNLLKRAVDAFGFAMKTSDKILETAVRNDAKDINMLIGVWLRFKQSTSWLSTLGPVVTRTWQGLGKMVNPKINIDPRQATVIKGIGSAAQSTAGQISGMGSSLATAFGFFGYAYKVAGFFKTGVSGASSLNETLSKTDAVLGPASAGVKNFANDMAAKFGLVKQETLDAAAGFGGMFKNQGMLAGKDLEAQTIQFTQAAADLKSFSHISFEDASRSLQTGLVGNESDALRKLGIDYSADAVKAQAYASGVAKVGAELTTQQELMVRSKIIMAGLRDSQGDLARTAGSSANMYSNVTGSIANLGIEIGSALMPALDRGLAGLSTFVGMLSTGFASVKDEFNSFVEQLSIGFDFVSAVVTHPVAAFQVLKLKATEVFVNMMEWAAAIGDYMPTLTDYISRNWQSLLTDLAINTLTACENISKNFGAIGDALGRFMADPLAGFPAINWSPLTDGFLHTAEALPGMIRPVLNDLSNEIDQASKPIWDDFEKRRKDAMKGAVPFAEAKGDALTAGDPLAKKTKEKKANDFGGVAERGTAEYVSSLNRALYGLPKKQNTVLEKQGDKTIKELQEVNANLRQQISQRPQQPKEQKIR